MAAKKGGGGKREKKGAERNCRPHVRCLKGAGKRKKLEEDGVREGKKGENKEVFGLEISTEKKEI